MEQLGRSLLLMGGVLVAAGLLLTFGSRLPFRLGRLPYLDIHIQRDNFSFYFPLGTSLIVSVLLTLVLGLINRR